MVVAGETGPGYIQSSCEFQFKSTFAVMGALFLPHPVNCEAPAIRYVSPGFKIAAALFGIVIV